MLTSNRRVSTLFEGAAKLPKLWARSSFLGDKWWWMMMTDDEWWWTHLERKRCLWYDEVMWKRAWKDRRTTQDVQYSTIVLYTLHSTIVLYTYIPKYTKYTEYTKYTKYTKYSTIVLYTLQYLHVPWFLQPYWTKSSLSALISGVQTCTILLHCKCWEPWQAKSSRSTFQWAWKIESLGRTLPRGVQIMLCLVPPKSWWGGGYIQNIYRIYTKCICLWSFFCIVTSNTSPSQILVRLRKTEFRIKNWV